MSLPPAPVIGRDFTIGDQQGGTQYRLFMTLVFCGIVAFNVSSNQDVSPTANNELVGLASVAVWILTLLGAFAVGPFRALRRALGW